MMKLSVIMDMTDKKMSPPTAFMMNRGTKICVAAAMLAPKIQHSNNCQNSLRDELNTFDNLNRDYESRKVFKLWINDGIFLKKADDKSGYLYDN